jgi:hypothetical protein
LISGDAVKGGYFVTDTVANIPSWANTEGTLCYCTADSKFYQYVDIAWVEKKFSSDSGIIDVAELPTEDISENSFYRVGSDLYTYTDDCWTKHIFAGEHLAEPSIEWNGVIGDRFSINLGGNYLVKVSDRVLSEEELIGLKYADSDGNEYTISEFDIEKEEPGLLIGGIGIFIVYSAEDVINSGFIPAETLTNGIYFVYVDNYPYTTRLSTNPQITKIDKKYIDVNFDGIIDSIENKVDNAISKVDNAISNLDNRAYSDLGTKTYRYENNSDWKAVFDFDAFSESKLESLERDGDGIIDSSINLSTVLSGRIIDIENDINYPFTIFYNFSGSRTFADNDSGDYSRWYWHCNSDISFKIHPNAKKHSEEVIRITDLGNSYSLQIRNAAIEFSYKITGKSRIYYGDANEPSELRANIEPVELGNINSAATVLYTNKTATDLGTYVYDIPKDLATKTYVDDTIDVLELVVADKASKDHKHSEYFTAIPSEYITESELNAKGYLTQHQSLAGYATENFVAAEIAKAKLEGEDVDLSSYATKDDLNSLISCGSADPSDAITSQFYFKYATE